MFSAILAGPHDRPPPQSSQKVERIDAAQSQQAVTADWLAQSKRPPNPDARHLTMADLVGDGTYPSERFIRQGRALADDLARAGVDVVAHLDWIDIRHPENSLFLTAPRSGKCPEHPYKADDDPDYHELLNLIRHTVDRAWHHPRRDLISLERF